MNTKVLLNADPAVNPPSGGGSQPATPPAAETITRAQLHEQIEKARLEERAKLRSELETATSNVTTTTAELTRIKGELDALSRSNSNGNVDVQKLITEITAKVEQRFTEATSQERAQLTQQVNTLSKDLNSAKLERLRNKLVAELGGEDKVVGAMIRGETEDEIRQSVKQAHQAYVDIENRVRPNGTPAAPAVNIPSNGQGNAPAPVSVPPVIDPRGQGGAGSGADGTLLEKVRELSPEEYKANRAKLKGELNRRYPTSR